MVRNVTPPSFAAFSTVFARKGNPLSNPSRNPLDTLRSNASNLFFEMMDPCTNPPFR
ncbi:hypothetical protein MCC01947_14800 [Bifidobacteriaceae bacterium MCC01947]|nr:hypothetical protein MCC01947_14800 [Bifidobacteriaceae bacterium MCC01947]GDZ02028.1 hypothetical protein MCC01941_12790 [Bifidobacteriaceae bacterium MCC01941]